MRAEVAETLHQVMDITHRVHGTTKKDIEILKTADKILLDTSDLTLLFQNNRRTIQRWRDNQTLKMSKIAGKCYYAWSEVCPLLISHYKLDSTSTNYIDHGKNE